MRARILTGALLAFAGLGVLPPLAQGDQASSRSRALLAGRIDAGNVHSCAVRADGGVRCWGQGQYGALGYGNTENVGDDEAPGSAGSVDLDGRSAVAVTAGGIHTCAILDNGAVKCWGFGGDGELGYANTNTIGDNETPGEVGTVNLGAGRSAVAISAGYVHVCALLDNGSVRCWGYGFDGELGYGNFSNIGDNETPGSVGPVNLGAGRSAVAIAAGAYHTCAILDTGAVRCWGYGGFGALGYGSTENVGDNEAPGSLPPVNLGSNRTAVSIAAGEMHTCAVLDNGSMRCWGFNGDGQLGFGGPAQIGDDETPGSAPTVNLGGRNVVSVTAGTFHTCAIVEDGSMRCWGNGTYGRLGYGDEQNIGDNETPSAVGAVDVGEGRYPVAITAGYYHTCALLDDGTTRCWGLESAGQLGQEGIGNIGDDEAPGSVGPLDLGEAIGATSVVAGGSHSCALLSDGAVSCWGNGANGRLGYGDADNIGDDETPGSIGRVDLGGNAVAISAGESHTCALLANGTVRCWGNGGGGRLGYGSTADVGDNETPGSIAPVNLGAGRNAIAIAAGGSHTCALLDNASVRCWGVGASGQLGYAGTATIGDNEAPGSVGPVDLGSGRTAVDIAVGADHTCALTDIGLVRCWGFGGNGQLGYANTTTIGDTETPASAGFLDLGSGRSGVSLGAGGNHTCARLENGTVRCWGVASSGQVGYANTTTIGDTETPGSVGPIDLGAGRTALDVSAGDNHTCAPLENGTVRCWGLNTFGQLGYANTTTIGDNETPGSVGPVSLGVGRSGVWVSSGGSHTCALLDNGTVRCWGLNSSGQLGYANTNNIGDDETPGTAGPVDLFDDPPTAVNDAASPAEDSSAFAIDVLANDLNSDGGEKSIAAKTDGAHGAVAITGGGTGLTYTPAPDYCGPDSFTYTLAPGGSTATVSVTVSCVDDAPVAVNDSATLSEDAAATAVDVLANDTDIDGGPKSVASKTNGAHGAVAITGGGSGLTYTPNADYCGPDSFTYTLNGGSTATVSVTVDCVDDAPVAVGDSKTLNEDAPATAIDVLANDTDPDGGPKEVASKTDGAHGAAAITGGGIGLTYTPNADYCGADSFTYTLNGGSTATVSVTVTCVDDAPLAVNDSATLAEDAAATGIDVLANDTDIDGGPKSVASTVQPAHGAVVVTGGGVGLTYQPAVDYCGPDSFTYTLNGGSTATVSVTVTCVDDGPVAVNDAKTLGEDDPATAIDVLANDTDPDGGPAKSIAAKTNGAHGTVAITGGGTGLTYTPAADYCGPDSFTYTLNGGSTATVSVTVTCVDDLPVAVNDSATLSEDAAATAVDVLANDTDIDGGPKSVASKTNGAHGAVAITGGGTGLTYTPAPDYCGPDSFTYELNGGSTATVSVTVTCVDDPPTAVGDSDTVLEDSGANAIDVLANDTDIDAGPRSIVGKTNGAHGTVAIIGVGAGLTYQPVADYCGPDSFTYTLNGGSTATVSMTVSCVDEPTPPTTGGGGAEQAPVQQTVVQSGTGSTAPVVNITPGVGVVSGRRHPRIAIKGAYAFFTLTCRLSDRDCAGTVTISASIPSIALGPTMREVPVVKGKFRVGSTRSVLVRAKLTKRGLEVLSKKRSLRGVSAHMAIVDTTNGEKGQIVVNLVRRPKASLLGRMARADTEGW